MGRPQKGRNPALCLVILRNRNPVRETRNLGRLLGQEPFFNAKRALIRLDVRGDFNRATRIGLKRFHRLCRRAVFLKKQRVDRVEKRGLPELVCLRDNGDPFADSGDRGAFSGEFSNIG